MSLRVGHMGRFERPVNRVVGDLQKERGAGVSIDEADGAPSNFVRQITVFFDGFAVFV